jgi:hypothetical protein
MLLIRHCHNNPSGVCAKIEEKALSFSELFTKIKIRTLPFSCSWGMALRSGMV